MKPVSKTPPYDWVWSEFPDAHSPFAPADVRRAAEAMQGASWLALIEQNSGWNDQQATYFSALVEALQASGAPIVAYGCDSDPRASFEPGGAPVSLETLSARHPGSKLLYFGGGAALAHLSGLLAGRMAAAGEAVLRFWPEGALLGPFIVDTDSPGVRGAAMRRASGERWAVLPSTLAAIAAYATVGPSVAVAPLASALDDEDNLPPSPDLIDARDHVGRLATHFAHSGLPENALMLWLAGIAVPSEVRWPLTLVFGGEIAAQTGATLVTEENSLRLLRLSYVVEGYFSPSLRRALLGWLAVESPRIERILRTRLLETMRLPGNVPPSGSAAFEKHALEEAVQVTLRAGTSGAGSPEVLAAREVIRQSPAYLLRTPPICPANRTCHPKRRNPGSRNYRDTPRSHRRRSDVLPATSANANTKSDTKSDTNNDAERDTHNHSHTERDTHANANAKRDTNTQAHTNAERITQFPNRNISPDSGPARRRTATPDNSLRRRAS